MKLSTFGLLAVVSAGAVALAVARDADTGEPVQMAQATPVKPAAADPHAGHSHAAPAPAVVHSGPPGKAEVRELVFDGGSVERGTNIKHDFVIKNVGLHDLTVDAKPG